jgi:hypothetical protein
LCRWGLNLWEGKVWLHEDQRSISSICTGLICTKMQLKHW